MPTLPIDPPTVVNKYKEPYDVYIGRGSKWGNPFVIGEHGDRDEVIEQYAQWLPTQPELVASMPELTGKRLGCFCAPKACHGDVLVALNVSFQVYGFLPTVRRRYLTRKLELNLEDFTCFGCGLSRSCEFAFDPYNTNGDCIAEK